MNTVVPRLAATVLLLRDGVAGLEVFMVVRHYAIDFASGALVFPGGRVEPSDHDLAAEPGRCIALAGQTVTDIAIRVAAIRETFEECGVLLARRRDATNLVAGADLATLAAQYGTAFDKLVTAENLVLATDALVPFAHWITPAGQAKRFDTHFFAIPAPPDHVAVHDGHESVDSVWLSPAQALAGTAAGTYKMVFATHLNVEKLGRSATVTAALAAAQRDKIVTVEPTVHGSEGGKRRLRIPLAAGYGGEEFLVDLPPAMPSQATGAR